VRWERAGGRWLHSCTRKKKEGKETTLSNAFCDQTEKKKGKELKRKAARLSAGLARQRDKRTLGKWRGKDPEKSAPIRMRPLGRDLQNGTNRR